MEQQRLEWLLDRRLDSTATPAEIQELDSFLESGADSHLFTDALVAKMQAQAPIPPVETGSWEKMPGLIVAIDKPADREIAHPKTIPLFRHPVARWTAAAAAILILVITTLFIWRPHSLNAIASIFDGRQNLVSTGRGQQRELTLPDGTHIWLNAASSIRYPNSFDSKERSVELTGEAFFDVQHADKIPFLIHTGNVTTTVLGTSFDIAAYPNATLKVSVLTGKVKVFDNNQTLGVLEKGNRLTILDEMAALQKYIDTSSMAAWRTGALVYRDETLSDIVADLRRNFSDSIVIANPALRPVSITLSSDKDLGLKNTLDMIARTTGAHISCKNGTYTIE